ncbi:MAG: hypothetical protein R3D78_05335 [Paracoccaceae bacterium]
MTHQSLAQTREHLSTLPRAALWIIAARFKTVSLSLVPVLALGLARLGRLDGMRARTVMTEAALQNVAITIFVAGKLLGQPELSIPGLIYAVLMNLVALLIIGSAGLGARRAALARQGL